MVMQHRNAADVHDPILLLALIEAAIGTSAIEQQITRVIAEVSQLDVKMLDQTATISRCAMPVCVLQQPA